MSKLHSLFRTIYFIVLPAAVFMALGFIYAFPYDNAVNYPILGPVGNGAYAVEAADFDNDGDRDLALVNTNSNNVSVLLNNGDGTYGASTEYAVGSSPQFLTLADFNADGNQDMAVTNNYPDYDMTVLFGNGDGSFGGRTDYAAQNPFGIRHADFDGDGDLDLAVANNSLLAIRNVAIYLNNGAGTFAAGVSYTITHAPYGLAVADFDGDGDQDIAATAQYSPFSRVYLLLNNGNGTFVAGNFYNVSVSPNYIVSADLDGDGDQDLAISTYNNATNSLVSILKGNGNGTFAAAVNYVTDTNSYGLTVADFDGDGDKDLATANVSSNNVNILRNNGNATFAAKVAYATDYYPRYVMSADLDNDGDQDLVTANQNSNSISVLRGNGDATFAAKVDYAFGKRPNSIYGADFDNDGDTDIVVANNAGKNFSYFRNNGDSSFAASVNFSTNGMAYGVFAADFNHDDNMDVVTSNLRSNDISVFLGNGDSTFAAKTDYSVGSSPYFVFAADFNADGNQDVVTANAGAANVSVLLGNGDGTFAAKTDYAVGSGPYSVVSADFDNDGDQDLATANNSSNSVSILNGNGDGTFAAGGNFTVGFQPRAVAAADFDGDGNIDLATAQYSGKNISVLLGNGDGTFVAKVDYAAGNSLCGIVPGDFDGDGDQDLAVSQCNTAISPFVTLTKVSVFLNNGNGTFAPQVDFGVGDDPISIFAADMDGDTDTDLVTANYESNDISVLRSLRLNMAITQSGGSLDVWENGHADSFTAALTTQPAGNVVFDITSGDITSAAVSPSQITFTSANWNVPQTITVTAVSDADTDSENPVITVAVNGALSEDHWDAVADRLITASVIDNNLYRSDTEFVVPLEGLNLRINDGATQTMDPNVKLSSFGGEDAKAMSFNSVSDFLETKRDDFAPTKDWNLCYPLTTCPYGTYKVYAVFYNSYGSASETLVASINYAEKVMAVTIPEETVVPIVPDKPAEVPDKSSATAPGAEKLPVETEIVWNFTRNLYVGSWGNDVRLLQRFLNTHGCVLAETGYSSPGKETRFFGWKTRAALINFQRANGLPAFGVFGQLTREFITKNF
jgi:hypothetical protein